ncbi:MAG TPA: type II toxin-antitoxin system prevent-host-death family antitoxin [Bryobacteraceae bacterium]|jgi:prevent-host-death family protein|nr:type II toxin-antitoxin system prevent-host-death family antitoxin [Bryobacteraceae bacterium]
MVTVASKELKNRLGRYLRLVREGQPVQITDHGKPIGCILPLVKAERSDELAQLSRLIAIGGIALGTGKLRRQWKPARLKPGPSIAEMIDEERR